MLREREGIRLQIDHNTKIITATVTELGQPPAPAG